MKLTLMKDYILCLCLDKLSAELTACEELKRNKCLNNSLFLSPSVSLLSQQGNSGIVSMATVRGPGQTTAPGPKPQPIQNGADECLSFTHWPLSSSLPLTAQCPLSACERPSMNQRRPVFTPLPLTPTAKELNTTRQQPKY